MNLPWAYVVKDYMSKLEFSGLEKDAQGFWSKDVRKLVTS